MILKWVDSLEIAIELDETRRAPLFDREGWEESLLKDHWGKEGVFFSLMAQVMYVSFEEMLEGEAKPKPHHLAAIELAGEKQIALEFADRRIDKLSTGQKQKTSIARTMIHVRAWRSVTLPGCAFTCSVRTATETRSRIPATLWTMLMLFILSVAVVL